MLVIDGSFGEGGGQIVRSSLALSMVTGIGERGRRAETVAAQAVEQCRRYLEATAPVGDYLTDQLMLPMALAGSGRFLSIGLSRHARTHLALISQFLDATISTREHPNGEVLVSFG